MCIRSTILLVHLGKFVNVATAFNLHRIDFWEKKILKNYKFWTITKIKCENLSHKNLIRSISLPQFNLEQFCCAGYFAPLK